MEATEASLREAEQRGLDGRGRAAVGKRTAVSLRGQRAAVDLDEERHGRRGRALVVELKETVVRKEVESLQRDGKGEAAWLSLRTLILRERSSMVEGIVVLVKDLKRKKRALKQGNYVVLKEGL